MQFAICIIRILIFASALACLTLDSIVIQYVSELSDSYPSTYRAASKATGVLVFALLNDIAAIMISGYYVFTVKKTWNSAPISLDYIICGVEIVLWLIYAILLFLGLDYPSAIYGLLIMCLYIANAMILYQFGQKIIPPENNIPVNTNIGRMNNTNSLMIEMNGNPMIRMNSPPGVGMNSPPGVGMNNFGIRVNNPVFGTVNNSGLERNRNNAGVEMNNAGAEMNNAGAEANTWI